jgi:hypothetical protein
MHPRIIILAFALFFALTNTTHAGTRDPETPDAQYVEFGRRFPAVLRIRAVLAKEHKPPDSSAVDIVHYASAVVIRPNWALTAAHVISKTERQTILHDSAEYPITQIIRHPEYDEKVYGFHDLALCYSPKDFALEFYTPLYRDSDELNKGVTIAGFGAPGTFQTGYRQPDNKKRGGQSRVVGLENNVLICQPLSPAVFPLEFLITPGDSGGGLFIGDKLAGINSFLLARDKKPDGTYTDEGAHTRISVYADWIDKEIAKRAIIK